MILLFIMLLLTALYSFLFYFTSLSLWFYFLWIPVSLILAILTMLLAILIMFQYMKRTSPKNKFRHLLLYQACQLILFFSNTKIKVIGEEYIPNKTFVCYANHKSDIDVIALYCALKRVCSAVGKKSLFKYPIIKQCKDVFAAIALDRDNDREGARQIIETIKNIKNGLSYIIFPEGGIKSRETEEMVNLRAGAYKLVTKTGVLLLPATIIGSSYTKKRKSIFNRVNITIIFHKPISKEEYENLNTLEIGQIVYDMINADIQKYETR